MMLFLAALACTAPPQPAAQTPQRQCTDGIAEACTALGSQHLDGDTADLPTAVRYFERGCALSHATACMKAQLTAELLEAQDLLTDLHDRLVELDALTQLQHSLSPLLVSIDDAAPEAVALDISGATLTLSMPEDPQALTTLADTLASAGLIHAPVISEDVLTAQRTLPEAAVRAPPTSQDIPAASAH